MRILRKLLAHILPLTTLCIREDGSPRQVRCRRARPEKVGTRVTPHFILARVGRAGSSVRLGIAMQ